MVRVSEDFKAALMGIAFLLAVGFLLFLIIQLNNARIAAGERHFLTAYPEKAIQNVFVAPPALEVTQNEQVGWPGAPYQGKVYRARMRVQAATPLKLNPHLHEGRNAFVVEMIRGKGLCPQVKPESPGLRAFSGDWGTHSPKGQLESHQAYVLALPDHTYCVFYQFRAN